MTREHEGHYAKKHPGGSQADPALAKALADVAIEGRLSCTEAHLLAERCGVAPAEVGRTADLLEFRIVECQLGLFGYSPEKRIVKPAEEVVVDLRERLQSAARNGRITCSDCWKIADAFGVAKIAVASACEAMGLKVTDCQLGAF